ncbi:MAG TPA: macro domain-containing protein, partial [Chloroflexia bacterium]
MHSTSPELGFRGSGGQQFAQLLGPSAIERLRGLPPPQLGEVRVSELTDTPTRYILHVPIYDAEHELSPATVAIAAAAALEQAEKLDAQVSIAFTALGNSLGLEPADAAREVLNAVISHLERGSQLRQVIFALPEEETYSAYAAAYLNLGGTLGEARVATNYRLVVVASPTSPTVGEEMRLTVKLVPTTSTENTIELPAGGGDLHCFLSASGLRIIGPNAHSLARDRASGHPGPATFTMRADLRGQRNFTLQFFIDEPDTGSQLLREAVYSVQVSPPQANVALPVLQPLLDIKVAPQPDFVLRASASRNSGTITIAYQLSSRLPGLMLDNAYVGEATLLDTDPARIRALLAATFRRLQGRQPEDTRASLLSYGAYLFDVLFPATSAADFRTFFWQAADRIKTWLVIEDAVDACPFPWELVAPYGSDGGQPRILGEHYQ